MLAFGVSPTATAYANSNNYDYDYIYITPSPATVTVARGSGQQFTANGKDSVGKVTSNVSNSKLSWSVSGNARSGTYISSSGYLTVASDETATKLTVTVAYTTALSRNMSTVIHGTSAVTVTGTASSPPQPSNPTAAVTSINLMPATVSLGKGGEQVFIVTGVLSNGANTIVSASDIIFTVLGNNKPNTYVTNIGYLFVASDETATVLLVTASLKSNSSVLGVAMVNLPPTAIPTPVPTTPDTPPTIPINPPAPADASTVSAITLSPAQATVARGGAQSFTASATMGDGTIRSGVNNEVSFFVVGARNTQTTITDGGLLRVSADEIATSLVVVAALRSNNEIMGYAPISLTGTQPSNDLMNLVNRTSVGGVITIDCYRWRVIAKSGDYALLIAYDDCFGRSAFRADGASATGGGYTLQNNIDNAYRNLPSLRTIAVLPNLSAYRNYPSQSPYSESAPTANMAGSQTTGVAFALSASEVCKYGVSMVTGAKSSFWTRSYGECPTSKAYYVVSTTRQLGLSHASTSEKLVMAPAVWVKCVGGGGGNTVPISYGSVAYRGGVGGSGGISDGSMAFGSAYVIKSQPASGVTRPGSTFVSWNTRADGSGVTYVPGTTIYITGNLVLYAIWRTSL
jgi:hypothetical protein